MAIFYSIIEGKVIPTTGLYTQVGERLRDHLHSHLRQKILIDCAAEKRREATFQLFHHHLTYNNKLINQDSLGMLNIPDNRMKNNQSISIFGLSGK